MNAVVDDEPRLRALRAATTRLDKKTFAGVPDQVLEVSSADQAGTFFIQSDPANYSNFTTADTSNIATSYTASGIKK